MTITARTFIWLGLLIAVFAWAGLAILVWNVPPTGGPLTLFFAFAFLGVMGSFQVLLSVVQRLRGLDEPGRLLRQSLLAGVTAVVLLLLQYFEMLTPVTGGAALVLALILEVLIRQAWRGVPAQAVAPPRAKAHTMASQSSRGPKRSQRSRGARRKT